MLFPHNSTAFILQQQCFYEMKNLRLKRKITPFNCSKSNDFQEYKYCIFNKRTSPINEKKNYHKKNTNNLQSAITLFLSTQHIFYPPLASHHQQITHSPSLQLTPSFDNPNAKVDRKENHCKKEAYSLPCSSFIR